jgi:DNA-binding MarR family transcriptional regulator
MAMRLAALGFDDYRRSDSLALRWLAHGPISLATLNTKFGVSRQATRKVVDGLVERNFATVQTDPVDARRRTVELSTRGRDYAAVVITTVHELNADVSRGVDPEHLATAVSVLSFVAENFGQ